MHSQDSSLTTLGWIDIDLDYKGLYSQGKGWMDVEIRLWPQGEILSAAEIDLFMYVGSGLTTSSCTKSLSVHTPAAAPCVEER